VTAGEGVPEIWCTGCGGGLTAGMVCCPWCATPVGHGQCSGCAKPMEENWRVCPWCRVPRESSVDIPVQALGSPGGAIPLPLIPSPASASGARF
jgi:hypothetical protein